jgi:hypothetical protein
MTPRNAEEQSKHRRNFGCYREQELFKRPGQVPVHRHLSYHSGVRKARQERTGGGKPRGVLSQGDNEKGNVDCRAQGQDSLRILVSEGWGCANSVIVQTA